MEATIKDLDSILLSQLVVAFTAPTGTGKTVSVPIGLSKLGWKRIIHVQPRNVAVYSIYKYMTYINKTLFRTEEMINIGCSFGSYGNYNPKADINYVTASFINKMILGRYLTQKERFLDFADLIIIDEASDTSVEYSMMLYLIGYAKNLGYIMPSILLMSASKMKGIYEIDVLDPFLHEIPISSYNIKTVYRSGGSQDYIESVKNTLDIIYGTIDLSAQSVLVFLPSKASISKIKKQIPDSYGLLGVEVFEVNAKTASQIDELSTVIPNNKTRIILSTNVMEQSITVRWLSVVIDSMLEVIPTMAKNGFTKMNTVKITKSSADQRRGRVGREYEGLCYRLIGRNEYNSLKEIKQGNIHKTYIDNTIIEALNYGFSPMELFTTINNSILFESIERLIKKGILNHKVDTGILEVSELGVFCLGIPLNPIITSALYRMGFEKNKQDRKLLLLLCACFDNIANHTNTIYNYVQVLRNHFEQIGNRTAPTEGGKLNVEKLSRITDTYTKIIVQFSSRGVKLPDDTVPETKLQEMIKKFQFEMSI